MVACRPVADHYPLWRTPNMPKPDSVAELMRADAQRPPPADKLDKLRTAIAKLRDIDFEREKLSNRSSELGKEIFELKSNTIVALFDEAKVEKITIPAEGNLPAYEMRVGWFYKANLSNVAPEDLPKSIAYIKKVEPDLLKTTYEVHFGLNDDKRRKVFEKILKKGRYDYSENFGVPWNTLTAWLREQIEVKKKSPPLKLLGATVDRMAEIVKQRKARTGEAKATTSKGKK